MKIKIPNQVISPSNNSKKLMRLSGTNIIKYTNSKHAMAVFTELLKNKMVYGEYYATSIMDIVYGVGLKPTQGSNGNVSLVKSIVRSFIELQLIEIDCDYEDITVNMLFKFKLTKEYEEALNVDGFFIIDIDKEYYGIFNSKMPKRLKPSSYAYYCFIKSHIYKDYFGIKKLRFENSMIPKDGSEVFKTLKNIGYIDFCVYDRFYDKYDRESVKVPTVYILGDAISNRDEIEKKYLFNYKKSYYANKYGEFDLKNLEIKYQEENGEKIKEYEKGYYPF